MSTPEALNGLSWRTIPTSADRASSGHVFETTIPRDSPFFEGHFRGYPVLAAVVQLHELVLPCVRCVRPSAGPLRALSGVKFPARIQPGDTVRVTIEPGADAHAVAFSIACGDVTCTSGRLTLGDAAP